MRVPEAANTEAAFEQLTLIFCPEVSSTTRTSVVLVLLDVVHTYGTKSKSTVTRTKHLVVLKSISTHVAAL